MVGIFAGLKWRLVSSRFRLAGNGLKVAMIIGWVVMVLVLALIVISMFALRQHPAVARTVVVTLFTLQLISWVLAPLVAFGVDETVDPAKFALLPLRIGTLQRGLLVASLVGYLPVANAIVLLGAAIALSSSWALLPVAILCSALQLVICVVFSRASSTAMAGLMSGRRGRDLGMAVGFILFLGYIVLSSLLNSGLGQSRDSNGIGAGVERLSKILAWGPNGALAIIPSEIESMDWARLAIAIATAIGVAWLGWWWWSRALLHSLTSVPSTSEGSAPVTSAVHSGSVPVASTLRGMILLVIARDRVLTWRDPMRRMPWLMVAALAVLYPFLIGRGHGSLFAVALPATLMGLQAGNQYGVEGTGVWLHMVAFADRTRARGEVLGHSIFVLIPGSVILLIAIFLHGFLRGDAKWIPAALGACFGLMMGAVAAAGYLSAKLPYAQRQSRKSMFANSIPGQKARTSGAAFASMGIAILVALPAIAAVILTLTVDQAWGWVALLLGPVSGVVALMVLTKVAAATYIARMPEILAVVAVGDRS